MEYTFTQTVDLSMPGNYTLTVSTSLAGDDVPSNDASELQIVNSTCAPSMNCSVGDGLTLFQLLDICLLYTSPSPRDGLLSRMPSSA